MTSPVGGQAAGQFDPQHPAVHNPLNPNVVSGVPMASGSTLPDGFISSVPQEVRVPSATVVQNGEGNSVYAPPVPVAQPSYVSPQAVPAQYIQPASVAQYQPVPIQPQVMPQVSAQPGAPVSLPVNPIQPYPSQPMPMNQGYPQGTNSVHTPVAVGAPVHHTVADVAFEAVQAQQMAGVSFEGLQVTAQAEEKIKNIFATPVSQNVAPQSVHTMPVVPVQNQAYQAIAQVAPKPHILSEAEIVSSAAQMIHSGELEFQKKVDLMAQYRKEYIALQSHHSHH